MNAEVEAIWQSVVAGWDQPARHDALMAAVARHNCFLWAAERYKERKGDPIADKQLERIRAASIATMFATGRAKRAENAPYKRTIVIFIALMLLMLLGLLGVKLMHDARPDRPAPPPITKPARP